MSDTTTNTTSMTQPDPTENISTVLTNLSATIPQTSESSTRSTESLSTENLYRLELIYIQRLGCECSKCSERTRMLLDEIDKLQSKPLHVNIVNNFTKQNTDEPCCICMTGDSSTESYTLPCNHIMHVNCLDTWFIHNHTCPICRADFNKLNQ